jgi:hypothetical protein
VADRNEPVGARAGRVIRRVGEFFTTTEGERPAAGGAYSGMTVQEELEEAARARRELAARRAERAAARAARPSAITNRPVGGNLQAAQPPARQTSRAAATVPAGAVAVAPTAAPAATPPTRRTMTDVEREAEAALMMEANQPAGRGRPQSRPSGSRAAAAASRRRSREMTADELNQISLDLARGQRMGPLAPGAEQNIARAMGYKKGGLVGKKAGPAAVAKKKGGMVGAMKAKTGRPVGRPASGVKPFGTQKMAAALKGRKPVAMPAFKKGGKVVAKGKKK